MRRPIATAKAFSMARGAKSRRDTHRKLLPSQAELLTERKLSPKDLSLSLHKL